MAGEAAWTSGGRASTCIDGLPARELEGEIDPIRLPDLQRKASHGAGGKAGGRDRQIVYAHRHQGKSVKALLIGLGVTDLPRGTVFQRHLRLRYHRTARIGNESFQMAVPTLRAECARSQRNDEQA